MTKATAPASPSAPRTNWRVSSRLKGSVALERHLADRERGRWRPLRRQPHPAYAGGHHRGNARSATGQLEIDTLALCRAAGRGRLSHGGIGHNGGPGTGTGFRAHCWTVAWRELLA